jgi:hypothetical protein
MKTHDELITQVMNGLASLTNLSMAALEKESADIGAKAIQLLAEGGSVVAKIRVFPDPSVGLYVEQANGEELLISMFGAKQEVITAH